jgi:hypothetical protein
MSGGEECEPTDLPGEELARDERLPREHYLPIRRSIVIRALTATLPCGGPQEEFREFCRLLEAVVHDDCRARLAELKNAYLPFDPDSETLPRPALDEAAERQQSARLFAAFAELLAQANFRRLTRAEVAQAASAASEWGLDLCVDYDCFERLEVFVRGDVVGRRETRKWWNFFRPVSTSVPTYQRLALIFRLKAPSPQEEASATHPITLKLFKNIPKADVDTLLPGTQVRMTWFDHGQIVLPTLSGVALTLVKLVHAVLAVASLSLMGLLSLLGLIGGTIGYGVKSFFGYLRTKERYHFTLTRNLYFRNLDNNAGVLHRLVDEAEEQEFRELLLGWSLLWHAGRSGLTEERLDVAAERWLAEELGIVADFECDDALAGLAELQLVEQQQEAWRAIPLPLACERLRARRLQGICPTRLGSSLQPPHFANKTRPRRNADAIPPG